jgi:hypothetical protein
VAQEVGPAFKPHIKTKQTNKQKKKQAKNHTEEILSKF